MDSSDAAGRARCLLCYLFFSNAEQVVNVIHICVE